MYQVVSIADIARASLRSAALTQSNQFGGRVILVTTSGLIGLMSPLPAISSDVQILGPGADSLTVSGNEANSVFVVNQGVTATIAGLTVADGSSVVGGGIENEGTLTRDQLHSLGQLGRRRSRRRLQPWHADGDQFHSSGNSAIRRRHLQQGDADGDQLHSLGQLGQTTAAVSKAWHADSERLHSLGQLGRTRRRNRHRRWNGDPRQHDHRHEHRPDGADLYGTVISKGNNLIGNTSGGSGFVATDLLNVNPLLGPLQNNGGPTQTLALLPESPAIAAGSVARIPSGITLTSADRGDIVKGKVDIGAFQSRGFTFTVISGNNQRTTVNTSFAATLDVMVTSPYGEPVQGGVVTSNAPPPGPRPPSPTVATAPPSTPPDRPPSTWSPTPSLAASPSTPRPARSPARVLV